MLLRDALYLLQGIAGKYVQFSSHDNANTEGKIVFVDDLVCARTVLPGRLIREYTFQRYTISTPTQVLILRLSEVGYLYKRVEAFVRKCEAETGVGMIEQSLCHHLQSQLTEYYRLIAILESQMASIPQKADDDIGTANNQGETDECSLTLQRLNVWINEWRLRMRMMSICVEGVTGDFSSCLGQHRADFVHGKMRTEGRSLI